MKIVTEGSAAGEGKEPILPERWKISAFLAALAIYYAVYYILFAQRVAEYFKDIFRHFEFVRRLF
jgi:hypothetical protein